MNKQRILNLPAWPFLVGLLLSCQDQARVSEPVEPDGAARVRAQPVEHAADPSPEVLMPKPNPRVRFHAKPKPLAPDAVTEDWPAFLGPNHNAVSGETRLLQDWPEGGPALAWEMKKGTGYTSPAIQGERLVFLHRLGDEEVVECLHPETGESYWEFRYPTAYRDRFSYGNGPRSSPAIDGDRVYTLGVEGKLHCINLLNGRPLWVMDTRSAYQAAQDFFGVATTPLLEGDLLIVNVGAPGGPCVVALDKLTGEEVWRAGDQWGPSYASPVAATVHGKRRVFVFAGGESKPPTGGLLCLDPADGSILFRFPWRSTSYESVNASSPVVIGDKVFVSASYQTGGAMLKLLPDGSYEKLWTSRGFATHWNTAIHHEGYLYGFDGRHPNTAALVCFDAESGNEQWRETPMWEEEVEHGGQKRVMKAGTLRASLLRADGHFLCMAEGGHLLWLDLTPGGYRELARAWLFSASESWTLPVLSRGLLYVVQNQDDRLAGTSPRLLCYDLRESVPPEKSNE